MGNNLTSETPTNQFQHLMLRKSEEIVSLGKFDTYEDKTSGNFYLAFESSYGITNQELAESEISQLRKLDSLKNSCRLLRGSVGKSQMLCFENYSISLSFEFYPNNLLSLSKTKGPDRQFAEHEIWQLITDLVYYMVGLNSFPTVTCNPKTFFSTKINPWKLSVLWFTLFSRMHTNYAWQMMNLKVLTLQK